MRAAIVTTLLILCSQAAAAPPREHLAPPGWEGSYHDIHYSPVVKIGDRVIISGIPASQGATEEDKIRWAFQQMKLHLEAAGASLADVVELNSYHVATDHAAFRRHTDIVLRVHHEFFTDHYPAWTATGTTALFSQDAPMEIRAEALIGSGKNARVDIPKPAPPPAQEPAPAPQG
jgi:enamine deaminase RidA (YjgF/YER057c/UK114 family)